MQRVPLSHAVTERAQANGAVDQDLSIGLGLLPLLPARLPSPSWWHRDTPAEPAAKGEPSLLTSHQGSFSRPTSCLQEKLPAAPSCPLLPEESVKEEGSQGSPLQGRVGGGVLSVLLLLLSRWPTAGRQPGQTDSGPRLGWSGASLLAVAKQSRERCFQDCRLRGTGQG